MMEETNRQPTMLSVQTQMTIDGNLLKRHDASTSTVVHSPGTEYMTRPPTQAGVQRISSPSSTQFKPVTGVVTQPMTTSPLIPGASDGSTEVAYAYRGVVRVSSTDTPATTMPRDTSLLTFNEVAVATNFHLGVRETEMITDICSLLLSLRLPIEPEQLDQVEKMNDSKIEELLHSHAAALRQDVWAVQTKILGVVVKHLRIFGFSELVQALSEHVTTVFKFSSDKEYVIISATERSKLFGMRLDIHCLLDLLREATFRVTFDLICSHLRAMSSENNMALFFHCIEKVISDAGLNLSFYSSQLINFVYDRKNSMILSSLHSLSPSSPYSGLARSPLHGYASMSHQSVSPVLKAPNMTRISSERTSHALPPTLLKTTVNPYIDSASEVSAVVHIPQTDQLIVQSKHVMPYPRPTPLVDSGETPKTESTTPWGAGRDVQSEGVSEPRASTLVSGEVVSSHSVTPGLAGDDKWKSQSGSCRSNASSMSPNTCIEGSGLVVRDIQTKLTSEERRRHGTRAEQRSAMAENIDLMDSTLTKAIKILKSTLNALTDEVMTMKAFQGPLRDEVTAHLKLTLSHLRGELNESIKVCREDLKKSITGLQVQFEIVDKMRSTESKKLDKAAKQEAANLEERLAAKIEGQVRSLLTSTTQQSRQDQHVSEFEAIDKKIVALRHEMEQMKGVLRDLRITDLITENSDVRREMGSIQNELHAFRDVMKSHKDDVSRIHQQMQEQSSRAWETEMRRAEVKGDSLNEHTELTKLHVPPTKLESIEPTMQTLQSEARLQDEVRQLRVLLQTNISELRQEASETNERLKGLRAEVRSVVSQNPSFTEKGGAEHIRVHSELSDLRAELKKLRTDTKSVQSQATNLETSDLKDLFTNVSALQMSLGTINSSLDSLRNELKQRVMLSAFQDQMSSLTVRLSKLEAEPRLNTPMSVDPSVDRAQVVTDNVLYTSAKDRIVINTCSPTHIYLNAEKADISPAHLITARPTNVIKGEEISTGRTTGGSANSPPLLFSRAVSPVKIQHSPTQTRLSQTVYPTHLGQSPKASVSSEVAGATSITHLNTIGGNTNFGVPSSYPMITAIPPVAHSPTHISEHMVATSHHRARTTSDYHQYFAGGVTKDSSPLAHLQKQKEMDGELLQILEQHYKAAIRNS